MVLRKKLRVLVVEDSLFFREVLVQGIESDGGIEVVGTAGDPYEARDKIISLKPDVVTLDVEMPRMSGIEFLQKLIPQYPLPVVMVSAANTRVFDAINAGAVDFVRKPESKSPDDLKIFFNEINMKIKIASTAKLKQAVSSMNAATRTMQGHTSSADYVIAIGASTGGTEALYSVLKQFPSNTPGVVIVQHMPPVFTKMYADRLNNSFDFEVKEAEDGDVIKAGRVIIAKGGVQMKVVKRQNNYYVKVFEGEKVSGHCPSVDVLFQSVAEAVRDKAVGVILTGMGTDGAKGLLEMKKNGAFTVGQDEASSIVYGMPKVAYNIGAVEVQCSLDDVAHTVFKYLK
ncbi:MAG: chemotaxis response regulator protein-glutamate methylesterase [Clostridia bacterium]|nr:chemotaxis response regulator protein-glutamate methylesterase [Clostridia bacterium]